MRVRHYIDPATLGPGRKKEIAFNGQKSGTHQADRPPDVSECTSITESITVTASTGSSEPSFQLPSSSLPQQRPLENVLHDVDGRKK